MSILGKSEIIRRLKSGNLLISPIVSRHQIGASSVDLRMGNVLLMVRSRGASHVDPARSKQCVYHNVNTEELFEEQQDEMENAHFLEIDRQQKHERYELPFKSRFLLHPGALALVPTLEWVTIPDDLLGTVTARSTWAREGLSIATANIVEPNYNGIITLELANLGEIPIALYPGLKLAQITFTSIFGKIKTDNAEIEKKESQFQLSFEPKQGDVAKGDDLFFLPNRQK